MTQVIPPGVVANGMVKVAFCPSIADLTAPSVATDIKAATSVEASCYLTRDGFQPGAEDQAITDERLCSKQVFEDFGTTQYTIANLVYIYDAQNTGSDSNKLYEALPKGTTGFLVAAWGKDAEEDWAAGDIVDIYPVKLGTQVKQPPEANSKLKVAQKPFVTGEVAEDVALAA
jgi:hypothetical protein